MISFIDIFLLICLGFAAWNGWKNGFIYELVMFLALFAALYIAIHFSEWGGHIITGAGAEPSQGMAQASFIVTFVIILLSAWLLARVLSGLANNGGGEVLNRVGGGVFALAKSLIILSLFLILITGSDAKFKLLTKEQREKSWLMEPVYQFSTTIMPAVKGSKFYQRIEEQELIRQTEEKLTGEKN